NTLREAADGGAPVADHRTSDAVPVDQRIDELQPRRRFGNAVEVGHDLLQLRFIVGQRGLQRITLRAAECLSGLERIDGTRDFLQVIALLQEALEVAVPGWVEQSQARKVAAASE